MRNNDDSNWQAWIGKADEDDLSVQAVLKEGAPSTACFLAQQMAEKYLKALLVYHDEEFAKVHDLLELETRLLKIEPKIRELHTDLEALNRYYIETRYPGDYPEFNLEEAKKAYEAALRVREFVVKRVEAS